MAGFPLRARCTALAFVAAVTTADSYHVHRRRHGSQDSARAIRDDFPCKHMQAGDDMSLLAAVGTTASPAYNFTGLGACRTHPPVIFRSAGGWGDQLRGLVTVFYAAVMTCKPLKVYWTRPYALDNYFEVHFERTNALTAPSVRMTGSGDFDFFTKQENVGRLASSNVSTLLHTNAYQWFEIVRLPGLRRTAEMYGLAGHTRYELFCIALRTLLPRPTLRVQGLVNNLLHRDPATPIEFGARRKQQRLGQNQVVNIGVQIRTGGEGESWEDRPRHAISSVLCFASEVRRVCSTKTCAVFVTTDSRKAVVEFKELVAPFVGRVTDWPGPILHTDRRVSNAVMNGSQMSDVWEKTFIDWTTLSQVDVLLMSFSGFGWTAAWSGAVPYVRRLGVRGNCSWSDFDQADDLALGRRVKL
jgi:hypothetical protein